MREYHILHLEDSHSDADVVKRVLLKANLNFQYFFADDKESFIRGLTDFKPDVILCDHALPQFDSVMAFDIYKEMKFEIPFILVTGSVSEEYAVEMIKKGIDDYLLKTNLQRLPQAIKSAFDKRENEKKIRQVEKDLKQSETNLRIIFENTSFGFLLLDRNFNVISFNNQMNYFAKKLFGFDLQENVNLIAMFMVERQQEYKNLFSMILKGETISNETSYPQIDGKLIWYSIKGNPVLDQERNIAGVCLTIDNITERKNAEEKLWESEAHLTEAQRLAKMGSWNFYLKDDRLTWSEELYNVFGADKETFRETHGSFIDLIDAEDREFTLQTSRHTQQTGEPFTIEYHITTPKGEKRIIQEYGYGVKDENGIVTRLFGTAQDITERKQAEKTLQLSEEKYRNIFTNALEGIFQILPDGRYITVNPGFVNMLGYRSTAEFIATITGIEHKHFVQPERYNKLNQLLDVHSEVRGFEIQMYRKDGSAIWISLNVRAICDEHGTLLYYEGTAENINEDVKARKSVKLSTLFFKSLVIFAASELLVMFTLESLNLSRGIWENLLDSLLLTILGAPFFYFWVLKGLTRRLVHEAVVAQTKVETQEYRYRTLIDTAPNIIYTLTAGDGMITMLNPAFEVATGWSCDEWIGKTFAALIYPDDLQFAIDMFDQILRGKNPPPYELRIVTKSGTYFVGEFTSVPQFELGKIVGVLGIARDITERKRAEEDLITANKELAASNTELEQFAYVASHDLQEPLRMVSSFLRLLEKKYKGQLDDTAEGYINFAVDGAGRMKTLIQDLLMYSRVGNNKENFTTVDLNEIALYATKVIEEDIKKNQAVITVSPLPVITANNSLISQLLINLITNAIKYCSYAKPEIEVGYSEDKSNYTIFVKDNGIGIDPKFFDKIFVIFQRLHNKDEYSGTGIGLAICKKIAEIHKGKLWVESEVGKGSTFYFSIPKTKQSA